MAEEIKEKKEIKVAALKNGTVIDHIRSHETYKVFEMLGLESEKDIVIFATNLPSKKMGTKGIIKVAERTLNEAEFNKIAIISPEASISIIKAYKVREKTNVRIPEEILGVIKCSNPNCITNVEKLEQLFRVTSRKPLTVKCEYCERSMLRQEIHMI